MTNREYMQTLDNETFETVMWMLYFRPGFWINGDTIKKCSTPTSSDVCKWLDDKKENYKKFWNEIGV